LGLRGRRDGRSGRGDPEAVHARPPDRDSCASRVRCASIDSSSCRMSATAVRSPTEYESRLQRYLFERSEEGRAVRVGEKETSEQAAIVDRYGDLFSRDQLEALRAAEETAAEPDERERLYRLRKTCEGGLIAAQLTAREDELENRLLAERL